MWLATFHLGNTLKHYFFKHCFGTFPPLPETPNKCMLASVLYLLSLHMIIFLLFFITFWVFSSHLSFRSLIPSSITSNLLAVKSIQFQLLYFSFVDFLFDCFSNRFSEEWFSILFQLLEWSTIIKTCLVGPISGAPLGLFYNFFWLSFMVSCLHDYISLIMWILFEKLLYK